MSRFVVAACALLLVSCGARVDLKQALQITDVSTGWFDAGVVNGQNKLVPSVSFRLRDGSGSVDTASLNIVFRRADNGEEHEDVFKQAVDFSGGQTELMTIRANAGHLGTPPQTRVDMLNHSMFVDMDAVIFARQSSSQWVELHRVRVERKLLTQ